MASYEIVDYGSPDGAQFGSSATKKLSFYGATPIAQPAVIAAATDAASAITQQNLVLAQLKLLGLIASA